MKVLFNDAVTQAAQRLSQGQSVTWLLPRRMMLRDVRLAILEKLDAKLGFVREQATLVELSNGAVLELGLLTLVGTACRHADLCVIQDGVGADPRAVREAAAVAAGPNALTLEIVNLDENFFWELASKLLGQALGWRYDFAGDLDKRVVFEQMVTQVATDMGKHCPGDSSLDRLRTQAKALLQDLVREMDKCQTVQELDYLLVQVQIPKLPVS